MARNTYPEPYRSARKDSLVDPSTCYNRECVSYCAWRIKEATGKWPRRTGDMNGFNWVYRMPENGYKEVAAPTTGGKYVGVARTGNHVVWWEGGRSISEYNWAVSGGYHERTVVLGQFRWFQIVAPAKPKVSKPAPVKKPAAKKPSLKVGDKVVPLKPVNYRGTVVKQYDSKYVITELKGDRAVLSARGQVWAALKTSNLRKV